MRLTIDPNEDPHAAAEQCLAEGRPKFAMHILSEALKVQPTRADLRRHLVRIEAQASNPLGISRSRLSGAFVLLHVVVAWALLISFLLALLLAPIAALEIAYPSVLEGSAEEIGGRNLVLCGLLAVLWFVFASWAAVKLFTASWFAYLNILPAAHALVADACLPSVMTTWQFGSDYAIARRSYFAKRYG